MRRPLLGVWMCAVVLVAGPACASKTFVRKSVAEVNDKVGALMKSLEETQERVRQNEEKIADVDRRATAGITQAQQTASAANSAAAAATKTATEAGRQADARASAIEANTRKLVFETVVSADSGEFAFGSADLPDGVKAAVDELVARLTADPKGVWVEIEGHTDSAGDETSNQALGLLRAETVKRYLYEFHRIPLHKINVISYGERKPVAPNNTREGRAQNRRVVIKVLA